jgi:cytoskeleton protein RodZ
LFEIGDTLREARSRKGLTLRDVEDGTKIRSRYIQALESDDFEVIPGPAYVKGFLRTYAGFLDLDPDLLVNEFRVRYEHAPEPQKVLTTRPQSQRTRAARRSSRTWVVGLIALVVIVALAWVGWGNRNGGKAEMNPAPVTTTTGPSGQTTATSGSSSTATSGVTTTIGPDGGTVKLVLSVAKDRSFLTVKEESASGKTLFSGTLDAGQDLSYSGKEKYWLNIGNPSALQMTINGVTVVVPEPYGSFLATSAGLSRVP